MDNRRSMEDVMELLIAALVLIFVIKFGWGLIWFCLEHWVISLIVFAAIIAYLA